MPRWLLIGWNAFGTLDLFTAIALGVLSTAGTPLHVFTEAPGTVAMGTLPWVLIPSFLVPVLLLTHLAVFVGLRAPYTEEIGTHAGSNNELPEAAVRRIA